MILHACLQLFRSEQNFPGCGLWIHSRSGSHLSRHILLRITTEAGAAGKFCSDPQSRSRNRDTSPGFESEPELQKKNCEAGTFCSEPNSEPAKHLFVRSRSRSQNPLADPEGVNGAKVRHLRAKMWFPPPPPSLCKQNSFQVLFLKGGAKPHFGPQTFDFRSLAGPIAPPPLWIRQCRNQDPFPGPEHESSKFSSSATLKICIAFRYEFRTQRWNKSDRVVIGRPKRHCDRVTVSM